MSVREVVRYQDPKSILVINHQGQIRQLFVPFRVVCIETVQNIPKGSLVYVESVFLHRKYILLYWINQRLIPYSFFSIQISW